MASVRPARRPSRSGRPPPRRALPGATRLCRRPDVARLRRAGRAAAAAAAGVPAIAVGQHDDAELRRAARDAGASRVYAYRALFEHGDRELGAGSRGLADTSRQRSPAGRNDDHDRPSPPSRRPLRGTRSPPRAARRPGRASMRCWSAWARTCTTSRATRPSAGAAHAARAARGRGRRRPWSPRGSRSRRPGTARRRAPGGQIATWEETDDPMALVAAPARRSPPAAGRRGRRRGRLGRAARRLRAGLQRGAAGRALLAHVDGAARPADAQGPRRGRALLRAAARRPTGRCRDRRRPAGRADRGRRRARGPGAAARRGPRPGRLLDRRVGAQQRVAAPRPGRPGHRGAASRSCSTSAAPSAATPRT